MPYLAEPVLTLFSDFGSSRTPSPLAASLFLHSLLRAPYLLSIVNAPVSGMDLTFARNSHRTALLTDSRRDGKPKFRGGTADPIFGDIAVPF